MVVDCNINVIVDTMSLLKDNYLPVYQHPLFVDHVNVSVDTMHLLQNNYLPVNQLPLWMWMVMLISVWIQCICYRIITCQWINFFCRCGWWC